MLLSEMTTKDVFKNTKQRMSKYQDEFFEQLTAIEVDAHWFRRVFHTFAASFLFYYLLPDDEWMNAIKIVVPILIVFCMIVIEYRRLRVLLIINGSSVCEAMRRNNRQATCILASLSYCYFFCSLNKLLSLVSCVPLSRTRSWVKHDIISGKKGRI